jgi:mannose-6-phosphate isomerase-like protein (cupin superfamily)
MTNNQLPTVVRKTITVCRSGSDAFKQDGLREYAAYRDLGARAATNGAIHAHVIRMIKPCNDDVRERHAHNLDFQMFYVLQGWMKLEFEGTGEITVGAGDSVIMPPNIKHTVLDYSPDLENLEIVMPAEFETVLAQPDTEKAQKK